MDDAFSKLDINGDGFISMEEILDKLPLETTDPDDDMESERFLQVSNPIFWYLDYIEGPKVMALDNSVFDATSRDSCDRMLALSICKGVDFQQRCL